jgi:preprotein translocase subunit SecG
MSRLSLVAAVLARAPDGAARARGRLSIATMAGVETLLSVLQVIISVVLVLLVLMHSGKDSGLSGAFGVGTGTGPLGGGSMVERNLNRWTIVFAVLFFVNAIVLLKHP